GWEPKRIDPGGCYRRRANGRLVFDAAEYRRRMLNALGRAGEEANVVRRIGELRGRLPDDPRRSVDGHDLVRLLSIRLHSAMHRRGLRDQEAAWSALSACI